MRLLALDLWQKLSTVFLLWMKIADANNKMLQEQNVIKKTLHKNKKKTTTLSITVIANKQQLEDDAQALSTKEAELKVAQLNLAAEKSSAENEKNALLQQKAEAEKRQRQLQQLKQLTVQDKGTTSSCESFCKYYPSSTSSGSSTNTCCNTSGSTNICSSSTCCSNSSSSTPVATVSRLTYSTSASSYPVGECTWGAKTFTPWAGKSLGQRRSIASTGSGCWIPVQDPQPKLVLLHVGMMADMDT